MSFPLPVSSNNKVVKKNEELSVSFPRSDTNQRTSSFYDHLDECIPCSIEEEQELAEYVPGLIIAGAQKGGTTFLLRMLGQHPDVADLRREPNILDSRSARGGVVHQCDVWRAYKELYSQCEKCKPHQFFVDKTPKYLGRSHFIPQRLACVFPKPHKVLVSLRDPTQRAFSEYQMELRKSRFNGTFYDEIVSEREELEASGVFPGLDKEVAFRAWKQFRRSNISTPDSAAPAFLSRGLYALQLTHWIDLLSELWGISEEVLIQNHLLVVDNDVTAADSQAAMNRILDFVGLAPNEFNVEDVTDNGKFHDYSAPTDREQKFLDDFFRPYNADLHHLLETYGIEIGFAKEAAEGN
eukprot:Nitzschia sp. Nitz4//scaffold691_size1706//70//1128//NITZ4_009317-RA/size1706-processed-gene-0.0-mRNA-1//-1//CDS//3329556643//3461//frame0